MLDLRADSIIYYSQDYLVTLVNSLVLNKRLGKALSKDWEKADLILSYLEAYEERLKIDDITEMNYILECLISLAKLNQFPAAPTFTSVTPPAILVGIPGPPGASVTGPQGPAGLATDFQVSNITSNVIVDTFAITDAVAARWEYTVVEVGGAQRTGTVRGTWNTTGSAIELDDNSTGDIVGSTAGIEFDVLFSGGNIQLQATRTSGTWTVIGTRYFNPNNGNGSGPISDVLPNGTIYIGNVSNQAQSRTVSGVISITNTGVTSFTPGIIVNADINASAAIALSKLATLPVSRLVTTDGSGILTTLASPTLTEVGHVAGVTSAIQTQLNTKLADPMTTIGDIIIRNGSNVTTRLGIGSAGQVLTVTGGLPTWAAVPGGISGLTTGFIPKASSATTITNSLISESGTAITMASTAEIQLGLRTETAGPYFKIKTVQIGDWNMDASNSVLITHGLTSSKIRLVQVSIIPDSDVVSPDNRYDIVQGIAGTTEYTEPQGGWHVTDTHIAIRRRVGGAFDGADFNATSFNRGWVTIWSEV